MKLTIRHNLFKLLIISLPMEYICTLISWMIRHKALQCITARSRCPNSVSIQAHGKIKSMILSSWKWLPFNITEVIYISFHYYRNGEPLSWLWRTTPSSFTPSFEFGNNKKLILRFLNQKCSQYLGVYKKMEMLEIIKLTH